MANQDGAYGVLHIVTGALLSVVFRMLERYAHGPPMERARAVHSSVTALHARSCTTMSAETTDEETETDVAADGHDHDHGELSEEEQAQAEADLARMGEALAAMDDNTLRTALAGMSEKSRLEVAAQLQLPRATMRLGDALMPLVRRKLQTAGPEHQLQVLFSLAQRANDQTVEALGPRSEEPTREDLVEVLPAVIEEHGVEIVTLMLAGYAASDALCRPVMRELLETDDRFVIGPPVAVEAKPELAAPAAPKLDKKELEAKREQRKTAKEIKRVAEIREREARIAADAKRRQAVHEAKRKTR